eukprot:6201610-Pleurochrysis_carterae.AAC.1
MRSDARSASRPRAVCLDSLNDSHLEFKRMATGGSHMAPPLTCCSNLTEMRQEKILAEIERKEQRRGKLEVFLCAELQLHQLFYRCESASPSIAIKVSKPPSPHP